MNTAKASVLTVVSRVPVVTVPTSETLALLPSSQARYKAFYKRFYRLRTYLPHDIVSAYTSYLKRRFVQNDYETRRNQLLGITTPLSETEMLERCRNTLSFVFNATVVKPNTSTLQDDETTAKSLKPIFYDDLKLQRERPELLVIRTIVEVELRKPRAVVTDFHWLWVLEIQSQVSGNDLEWTKDQRKSIKTVNIGFLNHDRNVMRLNESLEMCL